MKRSTIIYIGLGVGGAIGIFLLTRTIIKKAKEKKVKESEEKLKEEINNDSVVEQEQAKTYNPASDLSSFEDYVVGYNPVLTYEDEVKSLVNNLTNSELKILNTAFKKKHKLSMWKQLDEEWDNCGFFSNCYEVPMNRLNSLGLR